MDCPGHYFRRAKSIAVTIPCVAGPYTSVNCTLTLQKSTVRTSSDVGSGYARSGAKDIRFNDYYGALQSIVTSSGQSDSGLFETNLNDDRYLPFEGVGVAGSMWQLTLPAQANGAAPVAFARNPVYGTSFFADLKAAYAKMPPTTGAMSLYFSDHSMEDLWLAVSWAGV